MSDFFLAPVVDDDNPIAGDLFLDEVGDIRMTETLEEEVAQQLTIRLRTFLGEWHLDARVGMPFFRDILVKNPSLKLLRALYRRAIATTPGVDSVRTLELEVDSSRTAHLSFEVVITSGATLTFTDFVPFVTAGG